VIALIKATYEAGKWIDANPLEAVELLEKWTGVEKEVLYIYFSKGGHLTLDPTIKTKWVETLKFDHKVLLREQAIPPLDFDAWINEDYIRKAYAELGVDYGAEKARLVVPKAANAGLPGEIWHARDGISTYGRTADLLKAVGAARATGAKLNAAYVYDRESGLKLFGKTAYYVAEPNGDFSTFLRKGDAEKRASAVKGKLLGYDEAVALVTPP
jgi:NitT/TauT family transport system substrate-binding protein